MATPKATGPLDPEEIFKLAVSFDYSTHLLEADFGERIIQNVGVSKDDKITIQLPTFIPRDVFCCFTVELYFKCILVIETPSLEPHGHDLSVLFNGITDDMQKRIRRYYGIGDRANWPPYMIEMFKDVQPIPGFGQSLVEVIERSKKSFSELRYVYEKPPTGGPVGNIVRNAVRKAILDIKPEWRPLVSTLDCLPIMRFR